MGGEIVHCFCYIGIKVIAIGVCMLCPRYVDSQKFVVPPHVHRSESQRSDIFQSEQDRNDMLNFCFRLLKRLNSTVQVRSIHGHYVRVHGRAGRAPLGPASVSPRERDYMS